MHIAFVIKQSRRQINTVSVNVDKAGYKEQSENGTDAFFYLIF